MLHLILAAALSSSGTKPLFVAPKGMDYLSRDPQVSSELKRSGTQFIAEYRAYVHMRIGHVITPVSFVITIGRANDLGLDAADYAKARVQIMQREQQDVRILASKAVSLCDGRTGWLLSFTRKGSGEIAEQMFASGTDAMYVAMLRFPGNAGDPFGARKSLYTLCPPSQEVAQSPVTSLPFKPPAGWSRGRADAMPVPPQLTPLGLWLHLSSRSPYMESVALVRGPALPDGVTAQDASKQMIDGVRQQAPGFALKASRAQKLCAGLPDGWFTSYVAASGHRSYAIEQTYAATPDGSYIVTYTRMSSDPENPAARDSLASLCPALPATPSPAPASSATPPQSRP